MYRDYDSDGRLITWEYRNGSSILRKDQSFDLAGRIIAIADPNNVKGYRGRPSFRGRCLNEVFL